MDPATKVRAEPIRLTVLIPPDLFARLDAYREETDVPASAFGRRAIERMLDEIEGAGSSKRPRRSIKRAPARSA